jgi:hypothetical protein
MIPYRAHYGHATAAGRDPGSAGTARRNPARRRGRRRDPFSIANIFFELISTAGDLGVHVSLDGESWKVLRIEDPRGREVLGLEPKRGAKTIGLTELFFEGSEPPLVNVSFARFLELFPQGRYRFLGKTTGNQLLRSIDALTPRASLPVKAVSPPPATPGQVVVRGEPAPGVYNPDSGIYRKNRDAGLASYEVIVEVKQGDEGLIRHLDVELPPSATELTVPRAFIEQGYATGRGVCARGDRDRGDDHGRVVPGGHALAARVLPRRPVPPRGPVAPIRRLLARPGSNECRIGSEMAGMSADRFSPTSSGWTASIDAGALTRRLGEQAERIVRAAGARPEDSSWSEPWPIVPTVAGWPRQLRA